MHNPVNTHIIRGGAETPRNAAGPVGPAPSPAFPTPLALAHPAFYKYEGLGGAGGKGGAGGEEWRREGLEPPRRASGFVQSMVKELDLRIQNQTNESNHPRRH